MCAVQVKCSTSTDVYTSNLTGPKTYNIIYVNNVDKAHNFFLTSYKMRFICRAHPFFFFLTLVLLLASFKFFTTLRRRIPPPWLIRNVMCNLLYTQVAVQTPVNAVKAIEE